MVQQIPEMTKPGAVQVVQGRHGALYRYHPSKTQSNQTTSKLIQVRASLMTHVNYKAHWDWSKTNEQTEMQWGWWSSEMFDEHELGLKGDLDRVKGHHVFNKRSMG